MVCKNCQAVLNENSLFCTHCGQPVQQKKSRKKPILIGLLIALILVAALAAAWVFIWLTADEPGEAIAEGIENTLESGSFTVKFTAAYGDFQGDMAQTQGTMYVSIDSRNEKLMAQIQVEDSNGEVQETYGIYEGYFTDGYYYEDVSEAIDLFFLAYEEEFELDMLVAMLMNSLPTSYHEMLGQFVNMDKLETCMSQYEEKLDDERWLEAYAGFSKEKKGATTMYTFEPNIHSFLSGSLDVFETAFQNKYQYVGLKQMLRQLRTQAENTQVHLAFGVQNKRLVRLELKLSGTEDGLTEGETVKANLEISRIGNTPVDEDLLAQLLADAKSW